MAIKVITHPEVEPITLKEAQIHIRVEVTEAGIVTDETTYIESIIATAREWCEGFQNKAYVLQTIEKTFDRFPCSIFELPRPPMVSVLSIKYYDSKNIEYTLDPLLYFVDTASEPGRVSLNYSIQWPAIVLRPINSVIIRYTAGNTDASTVPKKVKQAILLLVGHWYENREAVGKVEGEIGFAVKSLLGHDRVWPT